MFRVTEMQKINVVALDTYRASIIRELHNLGAVQIKDLREKLENSEWKNFLELAQSPEIGRDITPLLLKLGHILGVFKSVSKSKGLIKELTEEPEKLPVNETLTQKEFDEASQLIQKLDTQVMGLYSKLDSLKAETSDLDKLKTSNAALEKIGVKASQIGESFRMYTTVGFVSKENYEKLINEVKKAVDDSIALSEDFDEERKILCISVFKEKKEKVLLSLRHAGFDELEVPQLELSEKEIDKRLTEIEIERKSITKELRKLATKWESKLNSLNESLGIEKERADIVTLMGATKRAFFLEGWIPVKSSDNVSNRLKKVSKGCCQVKFIEAEEGETVPVKLKNPIFARPFEMLTEMYSLPDYKEVDPTIIMMPMLVIFAGLMLTDFVYGLIVFIGGLLLWKKFGKNEEGIRKFGAIVTAVGASTMFFGVLTGGYFGDLPKYLFGLSPEQLARWVDPLTNPMVILKIAILFGLVHLNIGLVLGIYNNILIKKYSNIFSEQIIWFPLQICALVLLSEMLGFGAMPALLKYTAIAITLLSVAVLIKAKGIIGLFDLTGFFGDVASYTRLLALSLATGGIAMTMNLLAGMVWDVPFIGFILAALIFLVGQTFSLAMNTLGAFVHGLRLQYVEFFSKFYKGGGRKFTPFKLERKYTIVKGVGGRV